MSKEVIITLEYIKGIAAKLMADPDGGYLTPNEARFIIFCNDRRNIGCIEEGSKMLLKCGDDNCVNPTHVEITPPTKH